MDKIKAGFALLVLVGFCFAGAGYLNYSYAAAGDQTMNQTVKQAPVQPVDQAAGSTVSQDPGSKAGLPAEECPEPESAFWPWKMLMRLDAWIKRNLW